MQIRQATMEDAKLILRWKNYPETRKFAIAHHNKIELKDHLKWLKNNIRKFGIIGDNIGAVRIDKEEIAIWVDRAYWGKGIATEVVDQMAYPGMIAKIVDGNIASMRTFIKAGFRPIKYKKGYTIWTR